MEAECLGGGEWGGRLLSRGWVALEKHPVRSCHAGFKGMEGTIWAEEGKVHSPPEEQDQARLPLRMGGRGEALRAAGFVLLGYVL